MKTTIEGAISNREGTLVSKRGRPAKSGERYPGGKLKPAAEPSAGVLWQRLQAMKPHAKRLSLDSRLFTELGRLNWFGELTTAQTAAGHRIAGIYGRFESANGLRRSVASPSYMTASSEPADDMLGIRVELTDDEREARDSATRAAFHDLVGKEGTDGLIPRRLRKVIEDLCVEDRSVSPTVYPDLRELLQSLAIRWKITGGARPAPKEPAKLGKHTPLHFNKHDGETEAPAATPPPKKPNIDRIFWIVVAKKIAPHLSEDQLGEAYEIQQALKQREIFRRAKAGARGNVVPLAAR